MTRSTHPLRIAAIGVTLAVSAAIAHAQAPDVQESIAQDPRAAQPQRPTVATHAGTVVPGWVEIESGVEFDRYGDRSRGGSVVTDVKIGLVPRVQLELQTPVVGPPGSDATGIGDFLAGLKWRFAEKAPVLGQAAIFSSVKFPTGSTDSGTGTGTTDVSFILVSARKFGDVEMDLNVGYTRRSGNGDNAPKNASWWTASFGGPLHDWLGFAAELYGYPSTSGPAGADSIVAILVGPTATIRKWLVVDTGVIVPLTGPQPRAVYAGVTYNVGRLWGKSVTSASRSVRDRD
jgi:hypothetical protein